jgi:hypothetical protein
MRVKLVVFRIDFKGFLILTHHRRIISKTSKITPTNIDRNTIHRSNGWDIGLRSFGWAIVSIYFEDNSYFY